MAQESVTIKRKRGRPRLELPEPSKELQTMLDQLVTLSDKPDQQIMKAYNKAKDEGLNPKQAYKLIKEKVSKSYSPRQLRRLMPAEAKATNKTTKRNLAASATKAVRQETIKSMTKEELASQVLQELTDIIQDPTLGALGKVRAVARVIHRVDKEGNL